MQGKTATQVGRMAAVVDDLALCRGSCVQRGVIPRRGCVEYHVHVDNQVVVVVVVPIVVGALTGLRQETASGPADVVRAHDARGKAAHGLQDQTSFQSGDSFLPGSVVHCTPVLLLLVLSLSFFMLSGVKCLQHAGRLKSLRICLGGSRLVKLMPSGRNGTCSRL